MRGIKALQEYELKNPLIFTYNILLNTYNSYGTLHHNKLISWMKSEGCELFLLPNPTNESCSIESRAKSLHSKLQKVIKKSKKNHSLKF